MSVSVSNFLMTTVSTALSGFLQSQMNAWPSVETERISPLFDWSHLMSHTASLCDSSMFDFPTGRFGERVSQYCTTPL